MKSPKKTPGHSAELAAKIYERYNSFAITQTLFELPGLMYEYFTRSPEKRSDHAFTFVTSVTKAFFSMCIGERASGIRESAEQLDSLFEQMGSEAINESVQAVNGSIFHYFSTILAHADEIENFMHVVGSLNEINIVSNWLTQKQQITV